MGAAPKRQPAPCPGPGCRKTRRRVVKGVEVISVCAGCRIEAEEATKLTASCPHPGTRKAGDTDMRTCTACGALKCDDGTWEPPMHRPRIRRVV